MMRRIFLSDHEIKAGFITIKGEKARYLSTVLRCITGDPLIISDNTGDSYSARIIHATKKEIEAEIIERRYFDAESPLHITLLQGILKGEKMDFVVQKAAELGVKDIIPVITGRSQVRETRKLQRWKKIAEEASRQSGRNVIPSIHDAVDLDGLFTASPLVPDKGVIFWENGGIGLSEVIAGFKGRDKIKIFTGPEGGFSEEEITAASANGFVAATLGKRVLRAETAAITALSIIQYALGDLG